MSVAIASTLAIFIMGLLIWMWLVKNENDVVSKLHTMFHANWDARRKRFFGFKASDLVYEIEQGRVAGVFALMGNEALTLHKFHPEATTKLALRFFKSKYDKPTWKAPTGQ
jgi:hypothetical protein